MYIDLIYNLSLLISISVVLSFVDEIIDKNKFSSVNGKILQGSVFGLAIFLGMINPVKVTETAIFDGRTVLISLCGLFYGPFAAVVSMIITLGTRIYLGGGILIVALFSISISGVYGIIWHKKYYQNIKNELKAWQLFKFGFYLHIFFAIVLIALSAILHIPETPFRHILILIPMAFIYSFATILAGKIILDRRLKTNAELKFEKLFHFSSAGIALHKIVVDENNRPVDYIFLDMNESFEKITGLKKEKIKNKRVLEVLPDTEMDWIEKYGKVALEGKKITFALYNKGLDKHFSVMAYSPIKGQFVSIFYDITEYVKNFEENKLLILELEQSRKLEAIGRLAGGVAHDYNNILNVIMGNTDLALSVLEDLKGIDSNDRDEMQSYLDEIMRAAERSAALTHQLLGYARKQTVSVDSIDLNRELEDVASMLGKLSGADIPVTMDLCENIFSINFDKTQLHQIFLNFVSNSRDAILSANKERPPMQRHSQINISTENIEISSPLPLESNDNILIPPQKYVLLKVRDNGCGIDIKDKKQIFEPFFTTKEVGKGTGLGLSTIYGIVKQNKGYIDFTTSLDPESCGTEFRVYISASKCKDPQAVQTNKELSNIVNSKIVNSKKEPKVEFSVLFVEDDPLVRKVIVSVFENKGISVVAVSKATKALEFVRTKKFDIIISDIVMPGMNGVEFIQEALKINPKIKYLLISGYTGESSLQQTGMKLDERFFLKKPFTNKSLLKKINTIISIDKDEINV